MTFVEIIIILKLKNIRYKKKMKRTTITTTNGQEKEIEEIEESEDDDEIKKKIDEIQDDDDEEKKEEQQQQQTTSKEKDDHENSSRAMIMDMCMRKSIPYEEYQKKIKKYNENKNGGWMKRKTHSKEETLTSENERLTKRIAAQKKEIENLQKREVEFKRVIAFLASEKDDDYK